MKLKICLTNCHDKAADHEKVKRTDYVQTKAHVTSQNNQGNLFYNNMNILIKFFIKKLRP